MLLCHFLKQLILNSRTCLLQVFGCFLYLVQICQSLLDIVATHHDTDTRMLLHHLLLLVQICLVWLSFHHVQINQMEM